MSIPNCNNTYIQVAIPGSVLGAKNYKSICFRVGGEQCCFVLSPNTFSNTVCKMLPSQTSPETPCCPPPVPPEPPPPCVEDIDISGYTLKISYAPSVCRGGHICNRALFICYVNGTEVGLVNLNNGGDGGPRSTSLILPPNIFSDNGYKIELVGHPSLRSVHRGIARVEIIDLNQQIIFDECLPDDTAIFIPEC